MDLVFLIVKIMKILLIILGIAFVVGMIIALYQFPKSLRADFSIWFNKHSAWDWFKAICLLIFAIVVTICVIVALPPMGWLMALFLLLIVVNFVKSVFFASEDDDDV